MLQDYLSTLQSKGLIEVHHSLTKYATTPKGIKFVKKWKKLAKLLQLSIVARGPDRVNLDYSRPKRFECVSACVSGPSR